MKTRDPGICVHCKQPSDHRKRKLCGRCYRIDAIRRVYRPEQVTKPLDPNRPRCLHCNERNALRGKRLCSRCLGTVGADYRNREVGEPPYRGPSLEELESQIAERMKNPPAWWDKEPKPRQSPSLPAILQRMVRSDRRRVNYRRKSA